MFDIPLHINLFISLIELEHLLETSNKRAHIALPIYFFNWRRTSIKNMKYKKTRVNLK